MNPEDLPAATAPHEMDALECFAQQLTYYEHQHLLHQQRVAMEAGKVSCLYQSDWCSLILCRLNFRYGEGAVAV